MSMARIRVASNDAASIPTVAKRVTERIIERSRPTRRRYLDLMAEQKRARHQPAAACPAAISRMALPLPARTRTRSASWPAPNIGIVTAYNDMLSAHQPYGRYPEQMKIFAREVGATAQVAGGVPAMCDGVTQGQAGMDLSLFSRDVIAMATAVALSHGDVRRRGAARHLRQDRAGAADRRAALRPSADAPRARRADAVGAAATRKSSGSASFMPRARSARDELLARREPRHIIRRAPAPFTAPPIPTR